MKSTPSIQIARTEYSKFKNILFNIGDKGNFLLTRLFLRQDKQKQNPKAKDQFAKFHVISTDYRSWNLPSDLSVKDKETNEKLILAILNKDIRFLQEYNYSDYESLQDTLDMQAKQLLKLIAKKSHNPEPLFKEDLLKIEYSKYIGNRDYNNKLKHFTLKRVDDIDGHYIDNGYR